MVSIQQSEAFAVSILTKAFCLCLTTEAEVEAKGHGSQGMVRGNTSTAIVLVKRPHPSQERCLDGDVRQVIYCTVAVIVTVVSRRFFSPRVVLGVHPGPYVCFKLCERVGAIHPCAIRVYAPLLPCHSSRCAS